MGKSSDLTKEEKDFLRRYSYFTEFGNNIVPLISYTQKIDILKALETKGYVQGIKPESVSDSKKYSGHYYAESKPMVRHGRPKQRLFTFNLTLKGHLAKKELNRLAKNNKHDEEQEKGG